MTKVSIITPCYNSEKFIVEAIGGLLKQSLKEWEHVIVDDGSQDDSLQVAQKYANKDARIKVLSQPNRGVCNARNNGFKAASKDSEYLLFLDADDCPRPLMLERLSGYLDAHPQVGLARCEYRFMDAEGRPIDFPEDKCRYVPWGLWLRKLRQDEALTPFFSIFTSCAIVPSNSLIRRSVYVKTPGYDENFGHHHEDLDVLLHIALLSEIHYVPETLVLRRRHAEQNTAESPAFRLKAVKQAEKLYTKWRKGEGLTPQQKKTVAAAWRFKQGRFEPYRALLRARRNLKEGKGWTAIRCFFGGLRHYLMGLFQF